MKTVGEKRGFTPTPILKKLSMSLAYFNFLSLFSYQTRRPAGIGVGLHGKRGFTLIEIVIVIGIMGLFSAIIYSSFDLSRAKSRDQKRVSDISAIQLALEQYFQKNSVYPLKLKGPTDSLTSSGFLNNIPKDPSTNQPYGEIYFPLTKTSGSPNCISYQLWVKFELSNVYLNSKRGFDSTISPLPNGLFECGGSGTHNSARNAEIDSLIYDVMP